MHIKQLLTKKLGKKCWEYILEHLPLFTAECPAKMKSHELSFFLMELADEAALALFAVFIICYHSMLSRKKVYINSRKLGDSLIVVIMACKPPDVWKLIVPRCRNLNTSLSSFWFPMVLIEISHLPELFKECEQCISIYT